jgi:hypothetical protein
MDLFGSTDYDNADVIRSCARKKAYPTEAIARLSVSSIVSGDPTACVRPYQCRHCGLWHVGRSPVGRKTWYADEDAEPRRGRTRPYDGKSKKSTRRESMRRRGEDDRRRKGFDDDSDD